MKVAQSCPTLCDPMDHTIHGLLQARILEWVAIPFSRGSSQPRDWIQVSHCKWILYQLSHQGSPRILKWVAYPFSSRPSWPRSWNRVSYIAGRFFTSWATREVLSAFIACPSCTFWCHYKVEYRSEICAIISVPLILFKKHKKYTTWKTAVRKHKANSFKVRSV